MPAGRPPKATALKLLAGNPGKRKLPEELEVDQGAAVKPAYIAIEPGFSAVWDELAPTREAIGLLTALTAEAFGMLCVYVSQFRRGPLSLSGPQLADMRAKMNAFGFDPSSLTKLGIASKKTPKANPFSELTG
jgi:hypothetical protein